MEEQELELLLDLIRKATPDQLGDIIKEIGQEIANEYRK